jgi:hypothetical protein
MKNKEIKSAAALLGSIKSEKKTKSSRENGKLGGYHKWKKNIQKVDNSKKKYFCRQTE